MQQREEKQLEVSVDSLISRVALVKDALQIFIRKLENDYERLTWPSVLDNFALCTSQLNAINKLLKSEKTASFRSQVIIPLLLSPDRDEDLAKLTEQRVPVFSHEIVPDHLRTKPDPEVEEQEKQLSAEAARMGPEVAQKQIQALNKMCSNLLEKLNNPREDRDAENAVRQNKPSFNPADTNALVSAVAFGKGLSKCRPPGPVASGHPGQGPMMTGGPTLQQVTIGGGAGQQAGMGGPVAPQQQGQPGPGPCWVAFRLLVLLQDLDHAGWISGCWFSCRTWTMLGGFQAAGSPAGPGPCWVDFRLLVLLQDLDHAGWISGPAGSPAGPGPCWVDLRSCWFSCRTWTMLGAEMSSTITPGSCLIPPAGFTL
ncbi:mediator of RNA polymerase II transcription subunit 8 isoform X2 [Melanotaenia boesemani]|uniref:mediator of RNA polymerase II transcription subunit 8 isoform X2 n=1 Tax=Melanotaenia boesemani TaxID=1250792 RepID=UPI001C047816|nr:mediator of RNA polymerase II transcription subunit 8 isoform X2 [Melanotaenia boesemani]